MKTSVTTTDNGAPRNLAAVRLPELRKLAADLGLKGVSALPAKNDEVNKIDKGQNEIFPGGYTTVVHLVPDLGKYFTDKTVMEISNKTVVTQCKAPKSST